MNTLDQSFALPNFKKILESQNRKGVFLECTFFPNIENIIINIKECKKYLKNVTDPDDYKAKADELNELKRKKDEEIEKHLLALQEKDINLQKETLTKGGKDREIYTVNTNDPWTYFVMKQLQYNIKKIYKVKQNNRHYIISCLKALLQNKLTKYIFRTDIKDFYQNINSKSLLEKFSKDGLLSIKSRQYIEQILDQYYQHTDNETGVPAGVGISAYLSEIYMRGFDKEIINRSDVLFYARYVDDIIIIFNKHHSDAQSVINEVKQVIDKEKLSLSIHDINSGKTKYIKQQGSFDYLGYNFSANQSGCEISLSNNRIKKYKDKIDAIFQDYQKHTSEEELRRLLIKRLKFLTSNTRLINNKGNVFIGIYFSNSFIESAKCLDSLDKYLASCIEKIQNQDAKKELIKIFVGRKDKSKSDVHSFINGFNKKTFIKWSLKDLKVIGDI